ncbi:uncharacterized protein LOC114530283 isoform X2 [Dendronephthya gigantea]|uniref:uncharacterized protein LOC114530283 isoform X2 n=1 Tax=Dendronephthya gigantea TaxID=151771 RepID=UPI00106C2A39|nr:uncharacterized protein LOC114530283 isoform X2 [Dendronephthya gigantea]
MLKRTKVELPTTPEINPNRNEKVAKISEPQELAQESPDADGSLSCIKKPKLDSNESPGKNRSKKYVPPFTASKRFSSRLRLKRINQEKNESKSCRQEAIKCGGQNICGKPEKEKGSAMVLKSNEEKTEYLKCYKNNKDGNKRVIQQAPQVSELTQHFSGLLLRSGRVCEEMGMLENTISNSGNGGLKEGETCTFNRSSNLDETCMNNVASLQKTNKLDPNAYNFEASLHTLADTCAKEEYIIDVLTVEEETDQSKITPNANKSGKTKGSLARNGTTVKNIVGYSDINNVMNVIPPQYQEERMDMTICSPSKVKEMKLVEHRTTENMLSPKGVSARKETECKNVVTFATQGILNKPVHKSGCPELKLQDTAASLSQELIGNTLSEMLSIISHKKTNEPSFQSNESDNACSLAQHGDKTLGNSVVHTEMICTEQAGIHESGSSQDKRVESKTNDMDTGDNSSNTTSEKHVEVISFDEKNDNIKNEKIEIAAMNEKLPARANGNMNSQKATSGDMMEDAHKQLSSCVLKECEVEVDVGGRVESKDFKHVRREANNDQEVLFEKTSPLDGKCPDKIARTLPQCKERVVVKGKRQGHCHWCHGRY